ncbi:thrombospondin type 3 repeat-containing protein [Mucilaginibacter sp. HMF5004]|uniref:thrombospondin type 3 repeat-containing protein n=1 Tax=Mucilaginibacter rivuli TaxID=2857527 RepID=UPI001C5CEB07|nr:thrombospondin type 3 repeat-containing protein [Mucilaginibacter rivuli]MBW4888998.1 thrombospondin type 3 repeat-containing protein [Mucilaginibacter rivuli]
MNRNLIAAIVFSCAVCSLHTAQAQYPKIPPALQAKTDSIMDVEKKRSDNAFEKAMVIIKKEEAAGKPYVPWAAKPSDLPQAKIPAFPGAEGGGAYSFGGRGGRVIVVTNLNDSGPGSLRDACEQGGARIVVFNVAGIIKLKLPISIRAPYITIEGQSAPGDGICIAGESVWIDTHDVVARFLRFRRGATDVTRRDDGFGGNPVGNIMLDHLSGSWGLDEVMSMYRHVYDRTGKSLKLPTVNITMQNCMFAEALDTYNHAFGSTIGGHNSMFARNLWANNIARNPSVGMDGDFNFANNVIFNWWNRSADGGDNRSFYNFINNYYKPGPITPTDKPIGHRILKPEAGRDKGFKDAFGRVYANGNIIEGNERVTKNNWDGGIQIGEGPDAGRLTDSIRSNEPFPMPKIALLTAQEAHDYVLENVGANLPKRDAVDARIIREVKTGKIEYVPNTDNHVGSQFLKHRLPDDSYKQGIITDVSQVGGYPEYKGTPYKDSDNDGIPDAYEIKHGLNPKDAKDSAAMAKDGSGYANIEVYLNSLVPLNTVIPVAKK